MSSTVCPACNGIVSDREPTADDLGVHWCACAQVDAAAADIEDDEPTGPTPTPPPLPPLGV